MTRGPGLLCSYKTHLEFKAPKATLDLRFLLPGTTTSVHNQLGTALFCHLLADDLNEIAYEAELAGAQFTVFFLQSCVTSLVPFLALFLACQLLHSHFWPCPNVHGCWQRSTAQCCILGNYGSEHPVCPAPGHSHPSWREWHVQCTFLLANVALTARL